MIPLGPQLQACNRSPKAAHDMQYLWECTQKVLDKLWELNGAIPIVDDIVMGWDYLRAILDRDIKKHDIVLMVLLDSPQLYENKELDCWMYIWVILNLPPQKWYRKLHVLPSGFIPSPNKPKNLDSFLFPGFHHLTALQHEGLPMWDPLTDSRYISGLYLIFTTADVPSLIYWDGMVRHSGKNGCRLYCGIQGCCKENSTHYYPALLCPHDHIVSGGHHGDIKALEVPQGGSTEYVNNLKKIVSIHNQTQWDKMKTETGLTKPPLILGLHPTRSLGVPLCMTTDVMHLTGNLSDLLLSLWCGTLSVSPNDDKSTWDWAMFKDNDLWISHGEDVKKAGVHLPGVQQCQVNALLSALPELDDSAKGLPHGSIDLGDGYALRKRLKYSILPDAQVTQAIRNYLPVSEELPRITKQARLLLPNGQIARSAWREALKPPHQLQVSHNVKFTLDNKVHVSEVQYFTQVATQLHPEQQGDWTFHNIAIMKLYSEPDTELLKLSSQVLAASTLLNQIITAYMHNITPLKEHCKTLEMQLFKVAVEHDILKATLDQLAASLGSSTPLPLGSIKAAEMYPKMQFWTQTKYNEWTNTTEAHGNHWWKLTYLEDGDGNTILDDLLKGIHKKIQGIWAKLVEKDMAPKTWGKGACLHPHLQGIHISPAGQERLETGLAMQQQLSWMVLE
ncbi:hypothetical protein PAXRUDRAFT_15206 [Paxillus rubicundulus Ve08.2h10]|uniref:Uncharacterized protein n=1 Tax=Paxillus rubicundulus Ve08.2h10 TaxID=930991 RepID=A0A0D0DQC5_9AGAM|nr:hypothetical protein PAXRUDRAFT_15206 [Paxillus rubicundulus Ve08.2h10]